MDNSQIKVYRIGGNPEFQVLKSLGFTRCKYCGDSIQGLLLALGLGYLEELSLRQEYSFNNLVFLSAFPNCFEDLPQVKQIILKISSESSNQNEIVQLAKNSFDFLSEVIEFTSRIFSIRTEENIIEALNSKIFLTSLRTLNVQVAVYTYEALVTELKNNRYTHPVRINLLIPDLDKNVMNLYQDNYTLISVNNLNTSEEFFSAAETEKLSSLEDLSNALLEKISPPDRLAELAEELKRGSLFGLTLKGNEEAQLVQLFSSFADETGHLTLSEFIRLAFNKRMISNSAPLYSMLSIFQQAAGDKTYLNKDRFFFAVNLLGRALYPDEIMPLDLILTRILTEIQGDPPVFDLDLKVLLSEGILRLFEQAEEGFLNILMSYNLKNISNGRRVVGVQQIKLKNLGISPRNLVRYFKMKGNVLPAMTSVEGLQRIVEEVVPPKDMFSRKYFSYGFLLKFYDKDSKTTTLTQLEEIKGEPELRLSDLQLIFGKIALVGLPAVEDPFERVHHFIQGKLSLLTEPKLSVKYSLDLKSDSSLSSVEDPKEILKKHQETKFVKVNTIKESVDFSSLLPATPYLPSFEELEKVFDDERVPQVTEMAKTVQENPPPYALPPIQYPIKTQPSAVDAKASPKKDSKNRAETPGIKVKFATMPGTIQSISPQRPRYESFAEIRKNLNSSLFPENAKQMMSNPAIQPCLIREVFIPPPCPPSIRALIESCFVYQSKGEFKNAILALVKARKDWLKLENSEFLKADFELFFEMSKGAVYELCKKDELALAQYFSCKVLCDRLSFNHPDRALLYCGLASALNHLGQFRLATRSYLMAKKIRERCIGGDTIETATVYNNLGVCMYNLARYQEAFAYFELSEAIFMMMLGPNHARTLTVKQNISKVKRQNLLATPDFKVLWAKQFQDPFPKSKKKKGKKKKGKKR